MSTEAIAGIETLEIVGHFINGRKVAGHGRSQDVFNPATGKVVRQVALASKATVIDAIAAAEAAFPAWRNTPVAKRARIMFRFKELLEQNAERVVALLTEEHGAPGRGGRHHAVQLSCDGADVDVPDGHCLR